MRHLFLLGLASATLLGAQPLHAQPGPHDRDRHPDHEHRPPPPNATPNEAPPPIREERQAARAGFEWIPGRWDWKGKWEWLPGRWEKEHAGQHWNAGRWEHSGQNWSWVEGGYVASGATPPANDDRPRQPPPPPREEREAARAGFVWIPGRWDWKAKNWVWLPGRFEAERPGKRWRAAGWEQRDGAYVVVEGDWVDTNAAPPPPSGDAPPPHKWHVDRPTISSYWPQKGKVGQRVVIHGRNFPADAEVMWGPDPVRAAKVRDDEITFEVPAGAQSATILVKRGGDRNLVVGNFEVANFDADAEAKRIEAERIAAAQTAWNAAQARQAHDQAARQAAMDAAWQQRETDRESRRAARAAEIRAKFQAAFLADPDTQSELTLHAERVAELARAKDVAQVTANSKLGVRIDVATARENDRHDQRMTALQTAFNSRGGAR